ncbi:MAG: hypothetical protein K8F60_11525 [Melioribacteraceae bacterium]|nr:hypothetical protein [Melioribacteraceae bacterium]
MRVSTIFHLKKIEKSFDVVYGFKSKNFSVKICKDRSSSPETYVIIRKKYYLSFFVIYDLKTFNSYSEAMDEIKFHEFELKYE